MLQHELTEQDYAIVRRVTRLKTLMELSVETGLEVNVLVGRVLHLVQSGVLHSYARSGQYPTLRMSDRGRRLLYAYEKKKGKTAL